MMKKLLKRNQLKGLKIVFLDSGKSSIALEEFDDIFDFFNYLFETIMIVKSLGSIVTTLRKLIYSFIYSMSRYSIISPAGVFNSPPLSFSFSATFLSGKYYFYLEMINL